MDYPCSEAQHTLSCDAFPYCYKKQEILPIINSTITISPCLYNIKETTVLVQLGSMWVQKLYVCIISIISSSFTPYIIHRHVIWSSVVDKTHIASFLANLSSSSVLCQQVFNITYNSICHFISYALKNMCPCVEHSSTYSPQI